MIDLMVREDSKVIANKICPLCGEMITDLTRSFSLDDMNKDICYSCATKESLEFITKEKKVKIKLFNCHFAWIYSWLLSEFDNKSGINNRSDWIIRKAYEDFGVSLSSKVDLERLDFVVRIHHYIDKTDWLREKMRLEIKKRRVE